MRTYRIQIEGYCRHLYYITLVIKFELRAERTAGIAKTHVNVRQTDFRSTSKLYKTYKTLTCTSKLPFDILTSVALPVDGGNRWLILNVHVRRTFCVNTPANYDRRITLRENLWLLFAWKLNNKLWWINLFQNFANRFVELWKLRFRI